MKLQIKCEYADLVDIDDLIDIQGDLKKPKDLHKLKAGIAKHGFLNPVIATETKNGVKIVDGKHRVKALRDLLNEGYELQGVPVIWAQAAREKDVNKNLLIASSACGKISEKGFYEMAKDLELDELKQELSEIDFGSIFKEVSQSAKKVAKETEEAATEATSNEALATDDVGYMVYSIVFEKRSEFNEFWKHMEKAKKAIDSSKDYQDIMIDVLKMALKGETLHDNNKQAAVDTTAKKSSGGKKPAKSKPSSKKKTKASANKKAKSKTVKRKKGSTKTS